jgi:adenylate kinase
VKPETPKEEEDEESEKYSDAESGEEKKKKVVVEVDDKAAEALENFLPKKDRVRPNHLPFTEDDYSLREPSDEYRIIKEIEDKVLNFNEMLKQEMLQAKKDAGLIDEENAGEGEGEEGAEFKSGVKTYVVSAGILYGKGEAIFNSHLRQAWKQYPERLPYVGDGENRVPAIHVTDLARIVKAIYEKKPAKKYIFAVDNNHRPMQKKLVAAISNGIGTGLIESVDVPQEFKKAHSKSTPIQLDLDWKKSLLLDLHVQPSALFVKDEPKLADGEEPPAEEEGSDFIGIQWLCKAGLPSSIAQIKKEFEHARHLRPMKVVMIGPPCVGKSFYAEQIAEHYNIPHIHLEKMLSELLSWDQEKEDRYHGAIKAREEKIH